MDWSSSIGPAKGVYRGKQQVLDLWASYIDAFDSLEWNPEEFIEVDESRLIVVNHNRARGRGSGVEVRAVGAQLWTIRDGTALKVQLYQSKAEALDAVGAAQK
jgi:ketosteroid isomerase-like protein